jgi:hypothetical protein
LQQALQFCWLLGLLLPLACWLSALVWRLGLQQALSLELVQLALVRRLVQVLVWL